MVNVALSAGQVLLALFLVVLNGFFVASEFALVRIRGTAVEQLVEEGRPGSAALEGALDNLDDYLATTQLGITVASLGLGWVGEPAVATLLEPVLDPVLPAGMLHFVSFAIAFSCITFLHVVFGELAPKTIAIQRAEQLALIIAPPMRVFYYLFIPGIVVFNGAANGFTRLIGVRPASEIEETLSEEELLMLLSRSGSEGLVDRDEVEMVERIFELDDTAARAVMVPQPDVVSVSPDTTLEELRSLVREEGHTRYPVVETGDSDGVVGFVDTKDLLTATDSVGQGSITAGTLAREMTVVPEMTPIDELLTRLQSEQHQMAAVIDEWGTLEGIVTMEDVVEEIVGEIHDEFDEPSGEPSIDRVGDGEYEIDGAVPISEVNERLDSDFSSDAAETIGGIVLDQLGHVPEPGDQVETGGYVLDITAVDGARVSTIIVSERDQDESA